MKNLCTNGYVCYLLKLRTTWVNLRVNFLSEIIESKQEFHCFFISLEEHKEGAMFHREVYNNPRL